MHAYRQGEHRCTASWLSGRLLSSQSEHPQCQGCVLTDRNVLPLSLECQILRRAPVTKADISCRNAAVNKYVAQLKTDIYLNVCIGDAEVKIGHEEFSSRLHTGSAATAAASSSVRTVAIVKQVVLPLVWELLGLQQMRENAPADFGSPVCHWQSTRLGVGASRGLRFKARGTQCAYCDFQQSLPTPSLQTSKPCQLLNTVGLIFVLTLLDVHFTISVEASLTLWWSLVVLDQKSDDCQKWPP